MKIVVIGKTKEYLGRIRRKGEVISVPDTYKNGKELVKNIEKKKQVEDKGGKEWQS
jgi:hypothetical protein